MQEATRPKLLKIEVGKKLKCQKVTSSNPAYSITGERAGSRIFKAGDECVVVAVLPNTEEVEVVCNSGEHILLSNTEVQTHFVEASEYVESYDVQICRLIKALRNQAACALEEGKELQYLTQADLADIAQILYHAKAFPDFRSVRTALTAMPDDVERAIRCCIEVGDYIRRNNETTGLDGVGYVLQDAAVYLNMYKNILEERANAKDL